MIKLLKKNQFTVTAILLILTISGCMKQPHNFVVDHETKAVKTENLKQKHDLIQLNSVLVAPVKLARATDFINFKQEIVDSIAYGVIKEEIEFEVVSVNQDPKFSNLKSLSISEQANRLNIGAVILIEVEKFDERIGTRVSAEQTAAVSFSMIVKKISDNSIIWKDGFSYQDQALSDNILKKKDKSKKTKGWSSSSQLFEYGVRELSKKLQKARLEAYLN
jgi:PBP1b-binding outer membrane lipoprotein LpoB